MDLPKDFQLHNCVHSNLQPRLAAYRMNPTFCLAFPVIVCRMPIIGASFGRFFDISSFAQSRLTSPPSGHITVSLWSDFSVKLTDQPYSDSRSWIKLRQNIINQCHTSQDSFYKWTKISSLEIDFFGLKMLVKSGLDFFILKFTEPLQRYLLTCQANSAFLGRFFCTGQQQL